MQTKQDVEEGHRSSIRKAMEALLAATGVDTWDRHAEDKARKVVATPGMGHLRKSLVEFETAVNRAWLWAENEGVTAALAKKWCSENRKRADWLDYDTVSAEAPFRMRDILLQYAQSEIKMPLALFAYRRIQDHLTKLLARESGVPVNGFNSGESSARSVGKSDVSMRVDIDDTPEEQLIDTSEHGLALAETVR